MLRALSNFKVLQNYIILYDFLLKRAEMALRKDLDYVKRRVEEYRAGWVLLNSWTYKFEERFDTSKRSSNWAIWAFAHTRNRTGNHLVHGVCMLLPLEYVQNQIARTSFRSYFYIVRLTAWMFVSFCGKSTSHSYRKRPRLRNLWGNASEDAYGTSTCTSSSRAWL